MPPILVGFATQPPESKWDKRAETDRQTKVGEGASLAYIPTYLPTYVTAEQRLSNGRATAA